MKKLVLMLLLWIPLCASAQLRFVVHVPFRGEPLFCNETACLRKVQLAKRMKKAKHKREVQARKLKRKNDSKEIYVNTTPPDQPLLPQEDKSKR